jgi:hypothetical protein
VSESKALAIIPRSLPEVTDLAERFAKSSLIPSDLKNKAADVFVTLLAGQELGLSPMAALRSIHVVKGKPVLAADAMVGLVLASGLCDYFKPKAKTSTSVTYVTKRKGDTETELTYTIEDAKQAGITGGDNWRKYTRAMLSARCKAELARDVYPDVLAGVYETSEADEIRGAAPVAQLRTVEPEAVDAEIVEERTPFDADAIDAQMRACDHIDKLRAIAGQWSPVWVKEPQAVRARMKRTFDEMATGLRTFDEMATGLRRKQAEAAAEEAVGDDDEAIAARDAE